MPEATTHLGKPRQIRTRSSESKAKVISYNQAIQYSTSETLYFYCMFNFFLSSTILQEKRILNLAKSAIVVAFVWHHYLAAATAAIAGRLFEPEVSVAGASSRSNDDVRFGSGEVVLFGIVVKADWILLPCVVTWKHPFFFQDLCCDCSEDAFHVGGVFCGCFKEWNFHHISHDLIGVEGRYSAHWISV